MHFSELGPAIRVGRKAHRLTQGVLAQEAGLSRTTLNQLENGTFPDIGVKKLMAILKKLDLSLEIVQASEKPPPDFLKMAATSANVSFKETLTPEKLSNIIVTGRVPPNFRPHMRVILDELPPSVLRGLVNSLGQWTKPSEVQRKLRLIAADIGSDLKALS